MNAQLLKKIIENEQTIEIAYMGGSNPGGLRTISPISIDEEAGRVRARCQISNRLKHFSLSKIVYPAPATPIPVPASVSVITQPIASINELAQAFEEILKGHGWNPVFGENYVCLHRRFKNGKLVKRPDISLEYEEYLTEEVFDPETGEFASYSKKRSRPWILRSKKQNTKTYGTLTVAVSPFLEAAEKCAPN